MSTVALSGCATAALQYGRDGLAPVDREVRANLAAGQYGSAYEALRGADAHKRDLLLRVLSAGTLGLYANRTDSSVWALDRAWSLTEARWTKHIANGAASAVVNDYVLPYMPGRTERLFIPFYGALSWLSRGNRDEAAVEARRLVRSLGEASPDATSSAGAAVQGQLHYVAGAIFEAAGERADAEVAYRNAARLVDIPVVRDSAMIDSLAGDVVVVLEQGFVGHPVPRDIDVWLSRDEQRLLRRNDRALALSAAESIRQRESLRAFQPWSGRRGFEVQVSISMAEFRDGHGASSSLTLAARDATQSLRTDGNVSSAVRADFERGQPARFTRALLRAATRTVLYKAAGDQLDQAMDDDKAHAPRGGDSRRGTNVRGPVPAERRGQDKGKDKGKDADTDSDVSSILHAIASVSLFALAATADVNDRPDVRSWNLLPHDLRVVRLRLPAGDQDVHVTIDGQDTTVGRAHVRAGGVTVLTQRLFGAGRRGLPVADRADDERQ